MKNSFVIKGNICQTVNPKELDLHENAYAVCIDGRFLFVFGHTLSVSLTAATSPKGRGFLQALTPGELCGSGERAVEDGASQASHSERGVGTADGEGAPDLIETLERAELTAVWRVRNIENEQERDALMREIELLCADYIKTNLMKIVENVGLGEGLVKHLGDKIAVAVDGFFVAQGNHTIQIHYTLLLFPRQSFLPQ